MSPSLDNLPLTLSMLRLLSSKILKKQKSLKTIQTLSCWYSFESSHWVLSDEYPFARVSVIFQHFLQQILWSNCPPALKGLNVFEDKPLFWRYNVGCLTIVLLQAWIIYVVLGTPTLFSSLLGMLLINNKQTERKVLYLQNSLFFIMKEIRQKC